MVQSILISMGSDEVTAIADTTEANDVAYIVRDNYNSIISRLNAPEHYSLFELSQTSSSTPTVLTVPTAVDSIEWIKYDSVLYGDTAPVFKEIKYMNLKQFIDNMHMLTTDDTTVSSCNLTVGSDTITLLYNNERAPKFYTTFNDTTIIMDSYDSEVETFLKKIKTVAYGLQIPTFTVSDSFTPTLDENLFPLLLNESKAQCFAEIKQVQNMNAEKKSRRAWINSQKTKRNINRDYDRLAAVPDYGRKR